MRRSILVATSAIALAGAMAIGPFGAAAAAPYVYGCTPANFRTTEIAGVSLSIYNGSASTANLTHKVLAGNGTQLNTALTVPIVSMLPPTHTKDLFWYGQGRTPDEGDNAIASSVRIVSNVPVSATLSLARLGTELGSYVDWHAIVCTSQQP